MIRTNRKVKFKEHRDKVRPPRRKRRRKTRKRRRKKL